MNKTNDKVRFTFRIPKDINEYLELKSKQWRVSKSGALIRIILEYSQEQDNEQLLAVSQESA